MAMSIDFKKDVLDGNLSIVRVILKDSLIIDPTFVEFNHMYRYAKDNMDNLLEEFDDKELDYDKENWTEDYMNGLKVELMGNFSDERLDHLKQIISFLYKDRIKQKKQKASSGPKVEFVNSNKESDIIDRVAKGVIVSGALVAGVGIVRAKTAMAVGGLLVATVGAGALIYESNLDK